MSKGVDFTDDQPFEDFARSYIAHTEATCSATQYSGEWSRRDDPSIKVLPISVPLNISAFGTKTGGYTGQRLSSEEEDNARVFTLQDLRKRGFLVVSASEYDRPIVDADGFIIAVVTAPPSNEYRSSVAKAGAVIFDESKHLEVFNEGLDHKRGEGFQSFNVGISHGQGSVKPTRTSLGNQQSVVDTLLKDPNIHAVASFQDASFKRWYPRGHQYYQDAINVLLDKHPEIGPLNFQGSVLPKAAFNLGGKVRTFKHIDTKNYAFGWCCVTSFGSFNHRIGGHIILWELGLVIEFPPGYCICFPSALVTHSNTPLQDNDVRFSFVQYFPGEILRYVDNGCQTDKQMKKKSMKEFKKRTDGRREKLERGYENMAQASTLIAYQFP